MHIPKVMIIFGQNGVGKSTLLYAVKQSVLENVVRYEDVIFISPLDESLQKEFAGTDVYGDDRYVSSISFFMIFACILTEGWSSCFSKT
jgi:predicted ATP-binding protein involved in virulence